MKADWIRMEKLLDEDRKSKRRLFPFWIFGLFAFLALAGYWTLGSSINSNDEIQMLSSADSVQEFRNAEADQNVRTEDKLIANSTPESDLASDRINEKTKATKETKKTVQLEKENTKDTNQKVQTSSSAISEVKTAESKSSIKTRSTIGTELSKSNIISDENIIEKNKQNSFFSPLTKPNEKINLKPIETKSASTDVLQGSIVTAISLKSIPSLPQSILFDDRSISAMQLQPVERAFNPITKVKKTGQNGFVLRLATKFNSINSEFFESQIGVDATEFGVENVVRPSYEIGLDYVRKIGGGFSLQTGAFYANERLRFGNYLDTEIYNRLTENYSGFFNATQAYIGPEFFVNYTMAEEKKFQINWTLGVQYGFALIKTNDTDNQNNIWQIDLIENIPEIDGSAEEDNPSGFGTMPGEDPILSSTDGFLLNTNSFNNNLLYLNGGISLLSRIRKNHRIGLDLKYKFNPTSLFTTSYSVLPDVAEYQKSGTVRSSGSGFTLGLSYWFN